MTVEMLFISSHIQCYCCLVMLIFFYIYLEYIRSNESGIRNARDLLKAAKDKEDGVGEARNKLQISMQDQQRSLKTGKESLAGRT